MASLRQNLEDINAIVVTSEEKQTTIPFEAAQSMFRQAIIKAKASGEQPSSDEIKDIQYSFLTRFLQDWINRVDFKTISIVGGTPAFPVPGLGIAEIPIQDNLSIRDNVYVMCKCLDVYYRETYKNTFNNSPYSNDPISVSIFENSLDAISVGVAYHYFVFQAITENFSIDIKEIPPEILDIRIKSGYKVISKISSLFEHLPLVMLDNLSTIDLRNPFDMNTDTNEVFIKEKVVDILKLSAQLFINMQSGSEDTSRCFSELSQLIFTYTHDHQTMQNMMDSFEEVIGVSSRKLHGCPLHNVTDNGINSFQSLFALSIDSLKKHYAFITKNRPELQGNRDSLDGGNTLTVLDNNTQNMMNSIAQAGKFIKL